jgi:hypothetical protein
LISKYGEPSSEKFTGGAYPQKDLFWNKKDGSIRARDYENLGKYMILYTPASKDIDKL